MFLSYLEVAFMTDLQPLFLSYKEAVNVRIIVTAKHKTQRNNYLLDT